MKKNIILFFAFMIISAVLLYIKAEHQSYTGSRISLVVSGIDTAGKIEKSDILLVLLSFLFLPKIIYEIFRHNFKNIRKNRVLMLFLITLYFYLGELLAVIEFYYNNRRIVNFFGLKKEMILGNALFSMVSPVNFFIMIMVTAIFLFMARNKE